MTLRVRPEAHTEILEAGRWYEQRQAGLGLVFVHEVDRALSRIDHGPERYAISYRTLWRAIVRRFPYAVYYLVEASGVIAVGVLHQSRDRKTLDDRS